MGSWSIHLPSPYQISSTRPITTICQVKGSPLTGSAVKVGFQCTCRVYGYLVCRCSNFASDLCHLHNTSLTSAQSEQLRRVGLIVQPRRVDLILSFVLAVQETDNMLWALLSRDSSSFLNVDRTVRVAGRNMEEAAVWARAGAGGELGVRWRGKRGREPRRELGWERGGGGAALVEIAVFQAT